MFVRASFLAVWLLLALSLGANAEPPPDKPPPLAFQFAPAGEEEADTAKPPFFRVFPGGKDKNDRDASAALSSLKFARGESKLYAAEDAKPGLIVVLRSLVLVPLPDGDYRAILEGEFNAVHTRLAKETMKQLLAGETTDLVFESETNKGVRPVAFKVKATTKLRAALRDGALVCYGGEGAATITRYGLTGARTFESQPVSLGAADNKQPVYIGRPVKPVIKSDGSPETLPIIN